MSRLTLEIPGPRYYTTVPHHDPPPISHNFDSRGESPLHHNSAPQESPYSSLNGALRPPNPPLYPPSDLHSGHGHSESLHQANLHQHRRDLPPPSHSVSKTGPERLMNSRRGRSHSPYPVIGHMPDQSSSQRPETRYRNPSAPGSYPHPQQDLQTTSHYANGNHIYAQQSYSTTEMMPYSPAQPNYPPPGAFETFHVQLLNSCADWPV
jgi:hypothetical protein